MIKDINSHTSSTFQLLKDSIITTFRNKPIVQDIDLIRLNNNNIKFLIEVKQSSYLNWKPFIKKNYPDRDYSKLDDFNYKALYKLAEKIQVDVLIFYYVKDNLRKYGIRIFKILNDNLDVFDYNFISLERIANSIKGEKSEKCKNRIFKVTKDNNNPNIKKDEENIYSFFKNNIDVDEYYYVENNGVWTMILSNGKNYEPIWIYVEVNINQSKIEIEKINLKDEFFPQIEIHKKTKIPLSIIAYTNELDAFIVYKFEDNDFIKYRMNKEELVTYYSKYLEKLN
jgi:hypothetical protein